MRTIPTAGSPLLLMVTIGSAIPASSAGQSEPTHVLELTQRDSAEPSPRSDVWLVIEGGTGTLTVEVPDGQRLTTDCILTALNEIKFQWSLIEGETLVTVQFVGKGSIDEGFEGTMAGMVDAQHRPEMSGVFALIPRS